MIDKIQAFGDSFTYGSDLANRKDTWPSLIAWGMELNYECWAMGGVGNQYIASTVVDKASSNCLSVINWTWIDRFDFYTTDSEPKTLRPAEDTELERLYYKHLHSETGDKLRNLTVIHSTIAWLRERNIPFVMTIMDQLLLDDQWNVTPTIVNMQNDIREYFTWFPEGQTFLEWSRANDYPESDKWHPLEEAHANAAKIMLPAVEKTINTYITTTQG